MSLLCRLKNLVHKGELEEKDLERIVIVPKDATNGDVIKAMFPNAKIIINECLGVHGTVYFEYDKIITFYPLDWWNSPYRKEQE